MQRRVRSIAAFLLLFTYGSARAEFPYPSNPAPCGPSVPASPCIDALEFSQYLFLPNSTPLTLPNDFNNDWKISSAQTGDPIIDSNPQELFGIVGASVDRAWQVTTGRPDVLIAVLDSGIRWAEPQRDLENKFYLNRRELPVPEASTNLRDPHDRNGDGVFNIRDYDGDTRVSDQNGNDRLDPEDLIFLFSDGHDDDANGYIDDISGWDFFEDDNDPLDEVRYGHGTGESHDSGAETNNGTQDVGTCPNCMLLEVRVGDSFVADVNDFAQGVVFATDSGAKVVQEALGTLNHSSFGQQAIDYAYQRGVVVIASAADEESNHNNWPANYNHTVEVNSVTRFAELGGVRQTPKSYLYLNGCTNYGGHIAVAVPSTSCSSEATGRSSGMAGLIIAAALNEIDRGNLTPYPSDTDAPAGFALSANEIKQLITQTADDINFDARPELDPPLPQNYVTMLPAPGVRSSSRFPSIAGWDQYFGYGRINADSAIRRIREGGIPPEASLESPAWFSTQRSDRGSLSVTGRVAAKRASSYRFSVDVAPGVQPHENEFVEVRAQENLTNPVVGELAQIDLAQMAELLPHGTAGSPVQDDGSVRGDPERFSFTVRIQVTDNFGNRGEDRRTLFLHDDPDLLAEFPLALHSDGAASPVMSDLDGDGLEELILATSDGLIHAFRSDATEIAGWPVRTDPIEVHTEAPAFASGSISTPHGAVMGGIAVGDLDRGGTLEVIAADLEGKVYVWGADGTRRSGFPVSTLPQYSFFKRSERTGTSPEDLVPDRINRHNSDNRLGRAILGGVSLGNLDASADGSLEILAGAFDRHIYAWRLDGTLVPGWPVLLKDPAKVTAVDPITNDVTLRDDANADIGTKIITPPSLGDLDGDGFLEVVSAVNEEYVEAPNAIFTNLTINVLIGFGALDPGNTRVYAVHHDGTRHGSSPIDHGWNPDAFVDGWPVKTTLLTTGLLPVVGTGSNGPPALADVDGDGLPEVATMSSIGPVYLFHGDGSSALGAYDTGEPFTFASDILGPESNSDDAPSLGAVGGVAIAEFKGQGEGFHVLAPTAGLGRALDTNLPAKQSPADNHLSAWGIDGNFLPAFPRHMNDLQFFASPTVADINGDGLPEALQGSGVWELHAVDINGIEATGWPKHTGGWMVTSPSVGDLDGDGRLEVAAVTREGNLFVWRTNSEECSFQPWRRFHHDEWSTGNYATDARPPATVSIQAVSASLRSDAVEFETNGTPGDDQFCGSLAQLDVRYSSAPIENEAQFAAATPVMTVQLLNSSAGRDEGRILLRDQRFAGRALYFASVAHDDAGNRTPLSSLVEAVRFPNVPTPSPTETETHLPTSTRTISPIPTVIDSADEDDSCAVVRTKRGGAWQLVAVAMLIGAARRRRRERRSLDGQ